jgi:anti-anti-sigma factor
MNNNDIVPGFDNEKDTKLKILLQKATGVDNVLVLYLTGFIDTYNSNYFQKQIAKAVAAGFIRLVFQCKSLSYLSSTGIGSFTAVLNSVKSRGGDMVLFDIQPKVYEVLQLLGFSQFFKIKENLNISTNYFLPGAASESVSLFPKPFPCPICSKKLNAPRSGRFRCSGCRSILVIDKTAQVFLG